MAKQNAMPKTRLYSCVFKSCTVVPAMLSGKMLSAFMLKTAIKAMNGAAINIVRWPDAGRNTSMKPPMNSGRNGGREMISSIVTSLTIIAFRITQEATQHMGETDGTCGSAETDNGSESEIHHML